MGKKNTFSSPNAIVLKLKSLVQENNRIKRKLAITAKELKRLYQTLENKIIERTKDIEQDKAKEEAIFLSIRDGLVATDTEGKILLVNKSFEDILGWKELEVKGKYFTEIVLTVDEYGKPIPTSERPIIKALRGGSKATTTFLTTTFFSKKDKTYFPVVVTTSPIIVENKFVGMVEVFRDITKEKEIDKVKTEFVSLASHQLRTPLSAINWYTEMLLAGDAGKLNEEQKKYLEEISAGSARMVSLVQSLLNVSRLDLGTFIIEPEPTNIVEIAKSVVKELGPQIFEKKLNVEELYTENLPLFQADKKLLRIVFQNLISNAVKYTSKEGTVKIELLVTPKDKIFGEKNMIEDSITMKISEEGGISIPENQKDRIFSKLFRADNAQQSGIEGTGLGLYIVKSILDQSGGMIWFKSEEGKETAFYFSIPLSGMKRKEGTKKLD